MQQAAELGRWNTCLVCQSVFAKPAPGFVVSPSESEIEIFGLEALFCTNMKQSYKEKSLAEDAERKISTCVLTEGHEFQAFLDWKDILLFLLYR